jgi:hippurate hydrolase
LGATATLDYRRVYPATINTVPEARFVGDTAAALVGEAQVIRDLPPSMGAEDFSFMLQVKPGAYFRLGQGDSASGGGFLHSPRYDFNDDVLPLGAAMFCALAERALAPKTTALRGDNP